MSLYGNPAGSTQSRQKYLNETMALREQEIISITKEIKSLEQTQSLIKKDLENISSLIKKRKESIQSKTTEIIGMRNLWASLGFYSMKKED